MKKEEKPQQKQEELNAKNGGEIESTDMLELFDNFIDPLKLDPTEIINEFNSKEKGKGKWKSCKFFKRLSYHGKEYKIGESVVLQNCETVEFNVGKIIEIYLINAEQCSIPIIQLHWYYQLPDLPEKLKEEAKDYISQQELFYSNHVQYILPEQIFSPCKVLTYKQYELELEIESASSDFIFFCRANFNFQKERFEPAIRKWQSNCILCEMPLNPDNTSVACEKCNHWAHFSCTDLKSHEDPFVCKFCFLNLQCSSPVKKVKKR